MTVSRSLARSRYSPSRLRHSARTFRLGFALPVSSASVRVSKRHLPMVTYYLPSSWVISALRISLLTSCSSSGLYSTSSVDSAFGVAFLGSSSSPPTTAGSPSSGLAVESPSFCLGSSSSSSSSSSLPKDKHGKYPYVLLFSDAARTRFGSAPTRHV